MSTKKWIDSNGICIHADIPTVYDKLPPDVYELKFDNFKKEFFIERLFNKFTLPDKIYDLETDLIDRVQKTFNSLDKNFGILLKGLKGTGKTIAAKMISNNLKLPVILVTSGYTEIGNFINNIDQDVIILFDEFEKMYKLYGDEDGGDGDMPNLSNLMTLMDGVFTSKYKRLFILTTNKEYLPDAMIARPSRIRYIKDFTDLSPTIVEEILNDMVINKKLIPQLLNMIKKFEIITIDIVRALAEEANLYNTADQDFYEIFNVKYVETKYEIFEIKNKKSTTVSSEVRAKFFELGQDLYEDSGAYLGRIKKIDYKSGEVTVTRVAGGGMRKSFIYKFKKVTAIHRSYSIF